MKNFYLCGVLLICGILFSSQGFSQKITGTVTDSEGLPLPGLTVMIDGSTTGTTTDIDGKYELKVDPGTYTIKMSFIGFKTTTKEVTVEPGKTVSLNQTMEDDQEVLDELVVVGYGVQRKRDVTGTIAKIEGTKVSEVPVPSFEAALQGQAAGVAVTQGSGLAGSASVIRIRGIASISAGGDPLYVVDGVPITQNYFLRDNAGAMNNNPLATLNPNDIASIEVLKDAAATGIYGSRGANGVILITTKRGQKKGLTFNFNTRFGIATPTARPNMLNSAEYLQLYQEAYENDGGVGLAPLPGGVSWEDARNTDTDWVDETIGTGFKHEYSFSVSKGTEKMRTYANVTYNDNESYLLGNNYERISGRLNVDYEFSKKLSVSLSSSWSQGDNNRVDAAWSGGLGLAMSTALPIYPVRNPDGTYFDDNNNAVRARDLKTWRTREQRTINNINFTYKPIQNGWIRLSGGYDYMDLTEDVFEPQELINTDHAGIAKRYPTWVNNFNYSATAGYDWDMNEKNKFKFMVGNEFNRSVTKSMNLIQSTAITGPFFSENPSDTSILTRQRDDALRFAFLSYFSRINYIYNDKYIFQGTARVDGSSKFGRNNRYGFFPSVSAGWILSEENFLIDNNTISFLKVRASYGITGNANIPDYEHFELWETNGVDYDGEPILFLSKPENPDLKWEVSNTFDAGIEVGFLKDRITADIAYYNKQSKDVLLELTLPRSAGYSEQWWQNVGEIVNEGIELSVKSRNLVGEFQWTTNFNIAYNYNEIKSIGPYSEDAVSGGTNDTRVVVGSPVGTNYLVRFSRVDPENGLPIYLDKNGEETYAWTPDDRVAVGDILPDAVGGITNNFSYKNWDLEMLISYSIGGKIYDSSSKRQMGVVTNWNMRDELFDRWQQPGDIATYPRLTQTPETYGSSTVWINTDLWLHDASYARMKRLSLGYRFNDFGIGSIKVSNARLNITGTNLLTWTKFPGLDPEIARDFENATDRNLSSNITFLTPPQERTLTIGFSANF